MFLVRFLCILLLGGGLSAPAFAAMSPHRAAILEHNLEAMDARLDLISNARREISLETFYFEPDEAGGTVLKALLERKRLRPALRVRILIDGWGSQGFDEALADELQSQGIEIKRYNPLSALTVYRRSHRDHRKMLVVDGNLAIVGGRNLANEHFGANPEIGMLDRELVLRGPLVARLQASFDEFWNHSFSEDFGEPGQPTFQRLHALKSLSGASAKNWNPAWFEISADLHADSPGVRGMPGATATALTQALIRAKSLTLEGSHVILGSYLARELVGVASHGGTVTIYTNSALSVNHYDYTSFSLSYFRLVEAAQAGIAVWGYDSRPIDGEGASRKFGVHSKTYLIDDELWIGSFNLDPRSQSLNSELLVQVHGDGLVRKVRANVLTRYAKSKKLKPDGTYEVWGDLWTSVPKDFTAAFNRASLFRYLFEPHY